VGQHLVVLYNKQVGHSLIASHLVDQHLLEGNQIIYEDLVSGLKGHCMSQIFRLGCHCLAEATAVTL
jgi:hypothetical protein